MLSAAAPLSDWLTWLETLSPNEIELGLERVETVLENLALSLPKHLLLIAGTNGKGSSVAMADALLRASGWRVGAYTSPHISRYNERIVVAGEPVDDRTIIAALQTVAVARGKTPLTYFEFGTLAAAVVFAAASLDVWLLEVGLGGRLDASNAFEPSASLITNVSLDHCDWLGEDVEAIGAEKAGVMRAGVPTVFGAREVPVSVQNRATADGADLLRAGVDFEVVFDSEQRWDWRGPSRTLRSLLHPGLMGEFQIENAAAVLMLLEAAGLARGIDAELVNEVLPALALAGRSQRVLANDREWFFDVAHNPAAAKMLAATLASTKTGGDTVAIVGILENKDIAGIIGPLIEHVDRWIAITPGSLRAIPAGELARQIASLGDRSCLAAESTAEAINFAQRSSLENDRILVTGSFFTVAPVIDHLAANSRSET